MLLKQITDKIWEPFKKNQHGCNKTGYITLFKGDQMNFSYD